MANQPTDEPALTPSEPRRCIIGHHVVGHICTCLALAERATEVAKMDWNALASERTYHVRGKGLRELNRFFYLAGWTLGRRDVGKPQVEMAGWIADLADLKPVMRELRWLARKYDRQSATGGSASGGEAR